VADQEARRARRLSLELKDAAIGVTIFLLAPERGVNPAGPEEW
jgi:hypothetical protein